MRAVLHYIAEHQERTLGALGQGLRRHGWTVEAHTDYNPEPCDLAVVWGVGGRRGAILESQRLNGARTLVLERGYMGDRFAWVSAGFDGLNGRADFCVEPDPGPERWTLLFAPLAKANWHPGSRWVLLVGQVPGDASVKGRVELSSWYAWAAARVREVTSLPVAFRPHPVAVERGQRTPLPEGCVWAEGSLATVLKGARCVVTYNSNTAVDAVLAGVPAIACDEGSMAWAVTGHDPGQVAHPPTPDRTAWLQRMAWCQWSREELADGTAWEHLRQGLEAAPRQAACG